MEIENVNNSSVFNAELAGRIASFSKKNKTIPNNSSTISISQILSMLERFNEIKRYLNTSRTKDVVMKLESESAVKDAVYIMLKPTVHDLIFENPLEKVFRKK